MNMNNFRTSIFTAAAIAAISFYCYHTVVPLAEDVAQDATKWIDYYHVLYDLAHVVISLAFGVAVVGWGKLIGLAFKPKPDSKG